MSITQPADLHRQNSQLWSTKNHRAKWARAARYRLNMPRTRAVDPAAPAVEVRRSTRRRRTVSAYRDGDVTVVLIPARFSKAEERRWVAEMIARLQAREPP